MVKIDVHRYEDVTQFSIFGEIIRTLLPPLRQTVDGGRGVPGVLEALGTQSRPWLTTEGSWTLTCS